MALLLTVELLCMYLLSCVEQSIAPKLVRALLQGFSTAPSKEIDMEMACLGLLKQVTAGQSDAIRMYALQALRSWYPTCSCLRVSFVLLCVVLCYCCCIG